MVVDPRDPTILTARHPGCFGARRPLDHHYEEDAATIPPTNPAHAPAIDAITHNHGLKQAQELGSTH
jgi:hypothetical protein